MSKDEWTKMSAGGLKKSADNLKKTEGGLMMSAASWMSAFVAVVTKDDYAITFKTPKYE